MKRVKEMNDMYYFLTLFSSSKFDDIYGWSILLKLSWSIYLFIIYSYAAYTTVRGFTVQHCQINQFIYRGCHLFGVLEKFVSDKSVTFSFFCVWCFRRNFSFRGRRDFEIFDFVHTIDELTFIFILFFLTQIWRINDFLCVRIYLFRRKKAGEISRNLSS